MTSQALPVTDILDADSAMGALGGDRNLWVRILDSFRRNQSEDVARITEACTEEDWDEARRLSHSLKSSAGSIGAVRLQAKALQLEELARGFREQEGDEFCLDRLNECLVDLQCEHREVLAHVLRLIDRYPAAVETPELPGAPNPALKRLVALLEEFDTAALADWARVRPGLPATLAPELLEQLDNHILRYDFEEAAILARRALCQLDGFSG